MKVLRSSPPSDPCLTSLDMLSDRLQNVPAFKNQSLWIPDHPKSFYQDRSKISETTVAVLLGSFVRRFLESEYWPIDICQIYTPSIRVANILHEMLFLPKSCIGLVDRYSLCHRIEPERPLNLDKPFTFVVAGRLSRSKNLFGVLAFVSSLQIDFHLPARLHFIGDFDDEKPDYLGRRAYDDFPSEFMQFLNDLDWVTPPKITYKLNREEWLKIDDFDHSQKILTSFSTFFAEDFNMSLAQAQEAGWYSLISDWGGHHEVVGNGVYKIPHVFIPKFSTPNPLQRGQAYGLARAFVNREFVEAKTSLFPHRACYVPEKISRLELLMARKSAIEKWGMGLLGFIREDIDYFADTGIGAEFFMQYERHLGSDKKYPSHLVFHPHDSSSESVADVYWENLGREQWNSQEELSLLATTDLSFRDAKAKILQASKKSFLLSDKNKKLLENALKGF